MALSLTLLPFEADTERISFSQTLLRCQDDRELFEAVLEIEAKHGQPVPADFHTYFHQADLDAPSTYGPVNETPYGDPLLYVRVRDLLALEGHPRLTGQDAYRENRAAWAYLGELRRDTKVALYWN